MLEPYRGVSGFPICTHSIEEEIALSENKQTIHESRMGIPEIIFGLIIATFLSATENIPGSYKDQLLAIVTDELSR